MDIVTANRFYVLNIINNILLVVVNSNFLNKPNVNKWCKAFIKWSSENERKRALLC